MFDMKLSDMKLCQPWDPVQGSNPMLAVGEKEGLIELLFHLQGASAAQAPPAPHRSRG